MYTIRNPVMRVPVIPDRNSVIATTQIQNLIRNELMSVPARVMNADDFFSSGRPAAVPVVAAPTVTCSGAARSAIADVLRSICFSWII